MGANERLRVAVHNSGLSIAALADAAGVDPKTCERWITQGRTPHRTNARQAALALLYNSMYVGDDWMIVNAHRFGINAYATPVLHLRRAAKDGLFDGYAESFENVWNLSRPAPALGE